MAVALRLKVCAARFDGMPPGVVISPRPLTDIVPVYKTSRDEITTQFDMNALERIGLLKMDFLGLTTLTVLRDAVQMVEQKSRVQLDIDKPRVGRRGHLQAVFSRRYHGNLPV